MLITNMRVYSLLLFSKMSPTFFLTCVYVRVFIEYTYVSTSLKKLLLLPVTEVADG